MVSCKAGGGVWRRRGRPGRVPPLRTLRWLCQLRGLTGCPAAWCLRTKQSCLAHGAALGTELCAGGSCHFSHSSWRGSSGAGGFSCQVAHCLDSTGSPAGTVGLPTQESQRKCRAPWYRVIFSVCLRSRCEGPCRFKGRVHRPPLAGRSV